MKKQTKTKSKGIVSWPTTERPREKLLHSAAETLSDGELLAVLLRIGKSGQSAEDLGRQLLTKFNGINGIDRAHIEELLSVPGMGVAKTAQLKAATGREIVRLLEKYNLSDTSEDIKGVAFERFLGRTFRGDIGQFFTPRTIVEFMVHMVDPQEGEVVCDPASGSGGFLIRVFEIVRERILADADQRYNAFRKKIEKDRSLTDTKRSKLLQEKYKEIQQTIKQTNEGSRLWNLANRCIFGRDANDRMARTSKMNMIMHGDGHGGVHHHDGFLNIDGIFEGRFDIVLTNPPFGANLEPTDKVLESDITFDPADERRYMREFGETYKVAQARVKAAINKPIASLFDLPKSEKSKIKTEILFIERCLDLLKPGGRMGIVLPEGVYNNPSLIYVREFCEDRAFIRAVVSLPQETFNSAGASVKASLLFMQKFTEDETAEYQAKRQTAVAEVDTKYRPEIEAETARIQKTIDEADEEIKKAKPPTQAARKGMIEEAIKAAFAAAKIAAKRVPEWKIRKTEAKRELRAYEKNMAIIKTRETRQLLKRRFDYPIFFYDAQHVGITATGEQDVCELYYNDALRLPASMKAGETTLEQYRSFQEHPGNFVESYVAKSNAHR